MLKHLRQPTSTTCVHTCIAMVAGKTVKDVIADAEELFGKQEGLGLQDELMLLNRYKVRHQPLLYAQLNWGTLYLATVPSLNLEAINHRVVIDMRYIDDKYIRKVLDPNKGTGRRYYEFDKLSGQKGICIQGYTQLVQIFNI